MAKKINEKHVYTQSADALSNIYFNEELIPQRYEEIGMRNISISEYAHSGDTWKVKTYREVQANVPGALKKFAKEWNGVSQTENWTKKGDQFDCDFTIKIVGMPVDIKGHMVVGPEGDGSSNTIEIDVVCAIPFIGGMAEEFVAGDIESSMKKEYDWIKAKLNQA